MSGPPQSPGNRSLTKYGLIIDEFGGWHPFQDLLVVLAGVAKKYAVSIGTVALRWLLERPRVAAAIVGASRRDRAAQNLEVFSFCLDAEDRDQLDDVMARRPGPCGDVFGLEREPGGQHAAIMRYNLNR